MPKRVGYWKDGQRCRTFIREWRERRNLTQAAVGERLQTSASMISRIETGETSYTRDTLEALAKVLGTDPASFLICNPNDGDANVRSG